MNIMKVLTTTRNALVITTAVMLLTGCAAKKEVANLRQINSEQQTKLNEQREQARAAREKTESLVILNSDLITDNTELKARLFAARQSLNEIANQEPECPEAMTKGVVFKVQIGAYSERNISDQLTKATVLNTEQKGDLQKTVIGQFRSYQHADRLKKQLRAMGVSDAWIVPYRDGNRVLLKEVLSSVDIEAQK